MDMFENEYVTQAKFEDLVNLMKGTNWPLEMAMSILKIDESNQPKIKAKLKELEIHYLDMPYEEYKGYLETRQIMAQLDENERVYEEGQKARMKIIAKLIKVYKMSFEEAAIFTDLDKDFIRQAKEFLEENEKE